MFGSHTTHSMTPSFILLLCLSLLVVRWVGQWWLNRLNRLHVLAHADHPPEAVRHIMDEPTYRRSVDYTLAKSRFGQVEELWALATKVAFLCSGFLPWSLDLWTRRAGSGALATAGWLLVVSLVMGLPDLPLEWWQQFRLEERFGFNKSTLKLWITDHLKMLALSTVLGLPLIAGILTLTHRIGDLWWLWAWGLMMAFQAVMMVLAPIFILPLFNKFTPLPEGPLRERLLKLGERTGFSAKTIQVADGSRRSAHSNAYFTGFGRFRKIVLYDTLVAQLTEVELEAVLAHEIGHYRRGHIPKMLVWAGVSSLISFGLLGWLGHQAVFLEAFGFKGSAGTAPVLLLAGLLGGAVTFWLTPLATRRSRRHEFEADAYAREAMGESDSLIGALRKLHEKNLSNLTPHPRFSGFYYSHPTLVEREAALRTAAGSATPRP
jgi:STE24 endopeptidase